MENSNQRNIFHVHTYRCRHAANVADEMYVKKAIELGAAGITFTDHAPFPGNPFGNRMDIQQLPEYLQSIRILKEKYEGIIEVKTGLEIEYLPHFLYYYEQLKSSGCFDVLMIGQHFYECDDHKYNFSFSKDELQKKEAEGICRAVIEGMATGMFQVVAHPDRMFRYCDMWNKNMEQMSMELIKTAVQHKIILEKNLSSMKKKNNYWNEFWNLVPDTARICIGTDAHAVDQLENVWEYQERGASSTFSHAKGKHMDKYIFYNGSRIKNLKGEIFGDFKVMDIVGIKDRYAQWKCMCINCGGTQKISAKYIQRERKCPVCRKPVPIPPNPPKEKISEMDLTNKDFGFWHVKEKAGKRKDTVMYTCVCRCGTVKDISVYNLFNRLSTSCGCSRKEDIAGKEFGFLKAIKPISFGNGEGVIWECECKCGKKINVSVSDLGWRRSCGCMKDVEEEQHTKIVWAERGQQLRSNNTSGIRGVNWDRGKWVARIKFCGKSYHLGRYMDKISAEQARREAEKHLYTDFLEWYTKEFPEQREKYH